MVAIVPGKVILDAGYGVVNRIVPGEELVTEGDVVVLVAVILGLENIDEREICRIGAADIVKF